MANWISATDVEKALGANAYREIYDEDGDGYADSALVALDIVLAEAIVDSYLRTLYNGALPTEAPTDIIIAAVLCYAKGHAHDRHPEYRRYKSVDFAMGETLCKNIQAGKQSASASAPQPVPSVGGSGDDDAGPLLPTFLGDGGDCCQ